MKTAKHFMMIIFTLFAIVGFILTTASINEKKSAEKLEKNTIEWLNARNESRHTSTNGAIYIGIGLLGMWIIIDKKE